MSKIEVVKQHDLKDCGACSLSCIIRYYNGYVPIEKIREDTCTNFNGTTAYHLIKAANLYGFETIGIRASDIHDKNIYLPAIVHLNLKNGLQHFAVLYKIKSDIVYLMDPARGKVKMPIKEFNSIWDNILILMTPISNIVSYDKNITISNIFFNLLKANKTLFILILIIAFLLTFMTIIGNFYFQIAMSSINDGTDYNFLKFITLLFLLITLFKVVLNYLKNYYLNYLNKNIDVSIFTSFIAHIFNLPLSFIQNRTTGEITSRIGELSEIKSLLAEIFTNVLLNIVLVMGTIVVLFLINAKLFLILCLVISLYLIVSLIFNKLIYEKIKTNIEMETEFNSTLVENIEMNTSIKNLNLIKQFYYKLEDKLVLMLKSNLNLQNFLNNLEFIKSFIYEIGIFTILSLGIYFVYKGSFDILSLITFNSVLLYLFDPIKDLVSILPKYNYLKASFNKLSEFLNIPEELSQKEKGLKVINNGSITVEHLDYSYNKFSNILTDINFQIEAGEKVLLSGSSGCGKSTICKLITRYYNEYTGNLKINVMSESDYSLDAIRRGILYIGQNESLFTGTIRDNIICYRNVSEEEFLKVVNICKLENVVKKRPHRYNSYINASLNNLSGGEKQRIILARGLLKKVKIMILDEALSEVNVDLEKEILWSIFEYYKNETLIYVTHKNVDDCFSKIINIEDLNIRYV
ncbi:MAG: peptidase domain-containing ABC transporter [Ruminococcus sp.]|nr:peptidase domain-containing ABC transporter [Ruminococcus sp.]